MKLEEFYGPQLFYKNLFKGITVGPNIVYY